MELEILGMNFGCVLGALQAWEFPKKDCLLPLVAKLLGYCIVAASTTVKLPQVLPILFYSNTGRKCYISIVRTWVDTIFCQVFFSTDAYNSLQFWASKCSGLCVVLDQLILAILQRIWKGKPRYIFFSNKWEQRIGQIALQRNLRGSIQIYLA